MQETQSHSEQWRSNCFLHRYPEPACKCHFETPSSPDQGDQWKAESIKTVISFYSALEDFGFERKRRRRHQGRNVCKIKKNIKPLYVAHRRARLHLYTYTPIYLSIYRGYLLVAIIFIFSTPSRALLVYFLPRSSHPQGTYPRRLGRDDCMRSRHGRVIPGLEDPCFNPDLCDNQCGAQ